MILRWTQQQQEHLSVATCEYVASIESPCMTLSSCYYSGLVMTAKMKKKWSCRLARVLLFYNIDLYSRSRRCCVMLYNGPLLSAGFYTEILSDECGLLGNERKEKERSGKGGAQHECWPLIFTVSQSSGSVVVVVGELWHTAILIAYCEHCVRFSQQFPNIHIYVEKKIGDMRVGSGFFPLLYDGSEKKK